MQSSEFFQETKSHLINAVFKWMMFFLIPGAVLSTIRIRDTGLQPAILYLDISTVFLGSVFFLRNKLSYRFRGWFIIIFFLLFGIISLTSYGIIATGIWWLILTATFTSLFFGRRYGYWITVLTVLIVLFFTVFFSLGLIKYHFDATTYAYLLTSWLSAAFGAVFIISTIVFSINRLNSILYNNQEELYKKNRSLSELNRQLEEEIENRKRTELEIKRSEEKLKILFQEAADSIFVSDLDGRLVQVNEQACKSIQYTQEELIGKNIIDIDTEFKTQADLNKVFKNLSEGNQVRIESRHKRKDGTNFPVEITISKLHTVDGFRIMGLSRDITVRKQIEDKLIDNEEKYHTLFESANDAIFIMKNGKFVDCNAKTLVMFGCEREQIIDKGPVEFSPKFQSNTITSVKLAKEKIQAALNNQPQFFEWKHQKLNGELFDAEVGLNKIFLNNEEYLLSIVRDITDRKKSEINLRESEERNRLIIDNVPVVIWKTSERGETIFISENVEQIYGYSLEEIYSNGKKYWLDRIHPDDLEIVEKNFEGLFAKNKPFNIEYRIKTKDGNWIWLHDFADTVIQEDEKKYAYGVFHDITEKKQIEKSLVESEEKLRTIFNSSLEGIVVFDLNNKILNANKRILDVTGNTEKSMIMKNTYDFVDHNDIPLMQKRMQLLAAGKQTPPAEIKLKNAKGELLPAEISSKLIDYENQKAILTIIRDITERKQMQRRIFQAMVESEEAERERYAKELHDGLGPILSTCKIYFHALSKIGDEVQRSEYMKRTDELLEESLQSIKEISNNLSPHILKNYGLIQALESFVDKLKNVTHIKFSIQSEYDQRLSELFEFTLYRTLVELINNSIKYSEANEINITMNQEKKKLMVRFSDNGKGFDYEKIKRQGKGFGLLNLENRIKEIGGDYSYVSTSDNGVHVTISLSY